MKVNFEDIFEHIGFLVYSIARPHGVMSELEISNLGGLVELAWKDNGGLTEPLRKAILEGIKFCIDNQMTSEYAYLSFENYYRIHSAPFGEQLKSIINSLGKSVFESLPSPEGRVKLYRVSQLMA